MTPWFSEDDGMDRAFTPGQGGCLDEVRAYASRASEDIRVPNNVQRQSVKTTVQVLTPEFSQDREPAHSGSDAKHLQLSVNQGGSCKVLRLIQSQSQSKVSGRERRVHANQFPDQLSPKFS